MEVHPDHSLSFPAVQKEAGHPTSQDLTLAPPVMDEAAIILLDLLGDRCKVNLRPALLPQSQERMTGVAAPDCPLHLGLITQHRAVRFRRRFLKQRRHAAAHSEGDPPSWRKLEVHERRMVGSELRHDSKSPDLAAVTETSGAGKERAVAHCFARREREAFAGSTSSSMMYRAV